MPDSVSLAFKRTNGLFAFDKLSCERTLSFDIPATEIIATVLFAVSISTALTIKAIDNSAERCE